ncbi:MAG: Uma2 family endonuclease [Spirulinaceae cyanobacterium]
MLQYDLSHLPTAEELPSVDFKPVDNEIQRAVPFLLQQILLFIWQQREDFFFGMDIAYYYDSAQPAISPDGFLSIGVKKRKTPVNNPNQDGRISYLLWAENYVVPTLVLECVSQKYGGEYEEKKDKYAQLGILYYVIYDGGRYHSDKGDKSKGDSFEVHRLENGVYVRQKGEPVWLPEIGLGIGRKRRDFNTWTREWLYWYDELGNRYPSPDEAFQTERVRANSECLRAEEEKARAEQEKARAEQEKARAELLATRLRELGIDPEQL